MADTPKIDKELISEVAMLARLKLSDEETGKLTEELGAIVGYVNKLAEVDVSEVNEADLGSEHANAWREDEPRESFSAEDALANAPDSETGYIRVPPIIG